MDEVSSTTKSTKKRQDVIKEPFITIKTTPVYFEEDWDTGIGGGLWSTGLAMARYLTTEHAAAQVDNLYHQRQRKLSILELGSGNGFLAVCWLALASQFLENLVITDTAEHLPMIRQTVEANRHILTDAHHSVNINILEHKWGEFPQQPATTESSSVVEQVQQGEYKFDLIVGSDVAYRKELYDPLIASLVQYSDKDTVSLIGVTMMDTTPSFFHKLRQAGFFYDKLADHLLDPDFRGQTFGIFVIQKE